MAIQGRADSEIARIRERIEALLSEALKRQPTYLLSSLGLSLGSDLNLLKQLTGERLIDFLRKWFSESLEIVQYGPHSNIFAVRYLGSEPESNGAPFDRGPVSRPENGVSRPPRFNHRFWAAFAKPLTLDTRAFDISTMSFVDLPSGEPLPEHSIEISPKLIPEADMANRDEAIARNIDAWLQSHSLTRETFLIKPTLRPSAVITPTFKSSSLLEQVIECLDRSQLSATSLTLDVVKALLQKRL